MGSPCGSRRSSERAGRRKEAAKASLRGAGLCPSASLLLLFFFFDGGGGGGRFDGRRSLSSPPPLLLLSSLPLSFSLSLVRPPLCTVIGTLPFPARARGAGAKRETESKACGEKKTHFNRGGARNEKKQSSPIAPQLTSTTTLFPPRPPLSLHLKKKLFFRSKPPTSRSARA